MTIRAARADDLWRKVLSRKYESRYEQLEYDGLFCLGSGAVRFRGGISAIVGGNGVGKSTLAAALGELLETELAERYVRERPRLAGSELKAAIQEGDARRNRGASGGIGSARKLTGDSITTDSWWLDPGFWAFHTRMQVVSDQNFPDMIEPLTPLELSEQQLSTLSYVVGKRYENCLIYEIADYADFDRFPYFKVRANGIEYGSEGMGQGELALMIMLWVLQDLRANSILILEEPESHVSPRSQAALMNVIAEAVATKGIWTIVTTHSPTIASRIPTEHLRLLARDQAKIEVMDDVRRHQIASVLGGGHGFSGVVLVEDEVAMELTVSILDEFAPGLLRQLEILPSGGESRISAALGAFPRSGDWFRLIGVYDGDQRGRINEKELNWPCVYLPGEADPAAFLINSLAHADAVDRLSAELDRNRQTVAATLEALTGVEPRDWIIQCVKSLVITKGQLLRGLFHIWLEAKEAREATQDFVAALAASYDKLKQVAQ